MTSTVSTRPPLTARTIFNDPHSFFFETLGALGYASYDDADVGVVLSTAGRISDCGETAWNMQCRPVAQRIPGLTEGN